ncbi:tetratricopeptide repeat protein [Kordiimonas aquimaris]|uniref:tetratricopeptide repeat protein n=1 Tax=Kordiimonas aquimaris TaxID=707591 RepID=UPI0021CF9A99|nr:tetratricopeptide repeat protein [Kordiimonas aquimaris]
MFRYVKTLTIAIGTMVALSSVSHAQVIYGAQDSNLTRAMSAMKAGEFESAATYYRRAVRTDLGAARLVPALNNLCAVEYAIGNYSKAEKACSEAIGENRHYWRAYVNRGNARVALGNDEAAHKDFLKAVKFKPGASIAKNALAQFESKQATLLASAP